MPSASTSAVSEARERGLLAAARAGDETAFERLIAPYRGELHAHCYRMLASPFDADDALQDAMLRAWRGLARFEGRSSLRSWLYTIATNTSLNLIGKRPKRQLPIDVGGPSAGDEAPGRPLVESVWIEPYPDAGLGLEDGYAAPEARYELRESVELAFVAAIQHLPATQRAVLILREVLGYTAREVAESLDTSVASVNSALQRARKTVDEKFPERSQQATARTLGDERLQAVITDYMDAMGRGDVDKVVSMLADEASWSMPPLASWYHGPDIGPWLAGWPLSGAFQWRHLPTHANGQLAIANYTWHEDEQAFLPFALDVLTLDDDQRIVAVCSFIARSVEGREDDSFDDFPDTPADQTRVEAIFGRLGLPDRLD